MARGLVTAMVVGVTGGSGFVGAALVRQLVQSGHAVRVLTRDPSRTPPAGVQLVGGDLTVQDGRLVRFAENLDVLFHCAGEVVNADRMRIVNVDGVRALVAAAAGRIGRWVQLSSAGVYGPIRSGVVSEDTALHPRELYERTKADGEALVMQARDQGRIASCTILRPTIVFGSGMPNGSLSQLIRMIQRGLFFFIGQPGASANYVHVTDVARALLACGVAAQADRRIYNLSGWCTIEDFANAIADGVGRPRPRLRLPEAPVRCAARAAGRFARLPLTESRVDALVNRSRYSIDRIQRELSFALAVPVPDGIADMAASRCAA